MADRHASQTRGRAPTVPLPANNLIQPAARGRASIVRRVERSGAGRSRSRSRGGRRR